VAKKKNRSESSGAEPPPGAPAAEEGLSSAAPAPVLDPDPGHSLAPAPAPDPEPAPLLEPMLAPSEQVELVLSSPPVAQPAPPVATVVPAATSPHLEERIRKLESLLSQVHDLQAIEERVAARVANQVQTTLTVPVPVRVENTGPSMLGSARALFEAGSRLLPLLPHGVAPGGTRGWLVWELIAEARAMVCMYLDPRYRLPWSGYFLPPVLFVAYLFSFYWLPFTSLLAKLNLAWALTVPVDLLLLYVMFKILGHEARRYRQTAPDLPPSLRL
jgi:hypothetical protein